jgi:hypothetical protein
MNEFFVKSKEIANDFLQSIVFLDDKAFDDDQGKNAFDPSEISKAFAKEKKICAVYNSKTEADIEYFIEISKKADIVILDWLIEINDPGSDQTSDAEADEPRGEYAKKIITELLRYSEGRGLKLIVIYTGENILDYITEDVHNNIPEQLKSSFELKKNDCEINSVNVKILVRAKSNNDETSSGGKKFSQRQHLQNKILKYDELPEFILNEFTKMTEGLLSNFALLSLSTIRNNSHKILGLFSKELDAAYLGHKVVLPAQSDSENLLLKLFGDTISDLLYYALIPQKIQSELIDSWVDNNIEEELFPINTSKHFRRTKDSLKQLIHSEKEKFEERFDEAFIRNSLTNKEKRAYYESKSTELFLNLAYHNKKDEINSEFAKLTHHKSLFFPQNTAPKLTLGTVIRSLPNTNNYYVCIQQRCDSVRLKKDEERKFLFLPLTKTEDNKFHIITPEGDKLELDRRSYSVKTIKFKCENNNGEMRGVPQGNMYIFKDTYGEEFNWILDLKDLLSQRIVTDYASLLSRVGFDESEWLRMAGNN